MAPVSDPCAALVARAALLPGEEEEMEFRLAFGAEEKAALYLSGMDFPANPADGDFIAVRTPDEGFNSLISHFLPHQILKGRVEGRTALLPVRRRLWIPGSAPGRLRPAAHPPKGRPTADYPLLCRPV